MCYEKASVWQLGMLLGVTTLAILYLRNIFDKFGPYLVKGSKKGVNPKKFTESAWDFFHFTLSSVCGLIILWDKPWLWNVTDCWLNFDNHVVTFGIWSHYIMSFSCALSSLIRLNSDVRRKDYYMMLLHHVIHIVLLFSAWNLNIFRICSLIQVSYDWCDLFFKAGKIAKYMDCQKSVLLSIFFTFSVVWALTRLIMAPYWEIKMVMEVPTFAPSLHSSATYHLVCACFLILNILNVIWMYFIMKMLFKFINGEENADEILSENES